MGKMFETRLNFVFYDMNLLAPNLGKTMFRKLFIVSHSFIISHSQLLKHSKHALHMAGNFYCEYIFATGSTYSCQWPH